MSMGDNFGGTLAQIRLRFLGTLFGAVFGYFVFITVQTRLYLMIAMFNLQSL
jgi:uncharacterized membrane protein YccC